MIRQTPAKRIAARRRLEPAQIVSASPVIAIRECVIFNRRKIIGMFARVKQKFAAMIVALTFIIQDYAIINRATEEAVNVSTTTACLLCAILVLRERHAGLMIKKVLVNIVKAVIPVIVCLTYSFSFFVFNFSFAICPVKFF